MAESILGIPTTWTRTQLINSSSVKLGLRESLSLARIVDLLASFVIGFDLLQTQQQDLNQPILQVSRNGIYKSADPVGV